MQFQRERYLNNRVKLMNNGQIKSRHRDSRLREIDFVVNTGMKRYYIQSALSISDTDKLKQEKRPLLAIRDSFQQIIMSKTNAKPWGRRCRDQAYRAVRFPVG